MLLKPTRVVDTHCVIGENPLWHTGEQRLYWVDIPGGVVMRYDPSDGAHGVVYRSGAPIGGFTFQADGALLLFGDRGSVTRLGDGRAEPVIEELPRERDSRFNDVIADPRGRVFCGTMSSDAHSGALYLLHTDGRIEQVRDGIGTSNGMGFTPDGTGFYHTDTGAATIDRYDYDPDTGRIANRRVFVKADGPGRPDGMTVDRDGRVWSAFWDGGCVVRYGPDGTEEERILFPARKVSSLTFGGAEGDDMYVTTAGGDRRATEGPGAGAIFRVRAGVRGVADFRSRIHAE